MNELIEWAKAASYYLWHKPECEQAMTEFCTCGMKQIKDEGRALVERLEANRG